MIRVVDLTHSYGRQTVLKQVCADFPQNSFTCLLGPNGAGKTTFLRTLAGILPCESGSICRCEGIKLSYLPCRPDAIFPYTAYETVSLGLKRPFFSFADPKDDDAIMDAMRQTDCCVLKDRLITELSSGERQRVFIAQAIVSKPKVLLLDEPNSSLDMYHQHAIMAILKSSANAGMTVIAALHDINLAAAFADRMYFMSDGEIIAGGFVKDVFCENVIERTFGMKGKVESLPRSFWMGL